MWERGEMGERLGGARKGKLWSGCKTKQKIRKKHLRGYEYLKPQELLTKRSFKIISVYKVLNMWKLKQLYKFQFIILKIRVFSANNIHERFNFKHLLYRLRLKIPLLT